MNIDSRSAKPQLIQNPGQTGRCQKRAIGFKPVFLITAIAAGIIASGCASSHQKLALEPVGPAPTNPSAVNSADGSLMVFTDFEVTSDFRSLHSSSASLDGLDYTGYSWEYSSYKVLSPEGKLIKRVSNNIGSGVSHPEQVELPAGKYLVKAAAHGYGNVTVPVVVANDQVTVLHLDGDDFWPREAGFNQTNTIRLPNGQIVGWRGIAANTP